MLHYSGKHYLMTGLVRDKTAPRLLYLPNEGEYREGFGQVGGRSAFAEMRECGIISALEIYSFLPEYQRDRDRDLAHQKLIEIVRAFQPGIIFWQHPENFPVTPELVRALRQCGSSPLIVYHEADPFDRLYKPIREAQRVLYTNSDVFLHVALGLGRKLWEEIEPHRHFYYSPNCVDMERFTAPIVPQDVGSVYDAVMFGSIARSFKSVIKQPGAKFRVELARKMARTFGNRFASFGAGWPTGTNCRGKWPHELQTSMIQKARMSVIWDLYKDHTFYFSDRLPIALASGLPFITSHHRGYEVLFSDVPSLFYGSSVDDLVDIAKYLHSLPLDEVLSIGAAGKAWMLANLEARVVFRRALDLCIPIWQKSERGVS
jgi:hypothetical protein